MRAVTVLRVRHASSRNCCIVCWPRRRCVPAVAPGVLHYQDTSTGHMVTHHRTRLGPCDVLRQNPYNAVLCAGHTNGNVTMWTPNHATPVVKMLCHRGAVKALAVDPTGHYLVTSGAWHGAPCACVRVRVRAAAQLCARLRAADQQQQAAACFCACAQGQPRVLTRWRRASVRLPPPHPPAGLDCQVKVWDVRTFKPLHAYFAHSPATCLDISQRGLLAVGQGRRLQLWRDCLGAKAAAPYLGHMLPLGGAAALAFCPYEDVLGAGCAGGLSSLLVPGAGEPNFDSFVANPYASVKERQAQEVAQLLDKLQPDTIMLEPDSIGRVRGARAAALLMRCWACGCAGVGRAGASTAAQGGCAAHRCVLHCLVTLCCALPARLPPVAGRTTHVACRCSRSPRLWPRSAARRRRPPTRRGAARSAPRRRRRRR